MKIKCKERNHSQGYARPSRQRTVKKWYVDPFHQCLHFNHQLSELLQKKEENRRNEYLRSSISLRMGQEEKNRQSSLQGRKSKVRVGKQKKERKEGKDMQRRGEKEGLPVFLQPWQTAAFVSICPSLSLSRPPASQATRQKNRSHTNTCFYSPLWTFNIWDVPLTSQYNNYNHGCVKANYLRGLWASVSFRTNS